MEVSSQGDTAMGDAWDPASASPLSALSAAQQGIMTPLSHPSFVMDLSMSEDVPATGLEAPPLVKAEASEQLDYRRSASLLSVSPQPSNNQSGPAKQTAMYTKEQWEAKKDLIEKLWISENRPWESKKHPDESVEQILRLEHDFPVTYGVLVSVDCYLCLGNSVLTIAIENGNFFEELKPGVS